ncbi:MAG: hypothetical protein ABSF51_09875 [Verrucomicrobiota bacterium]|jgi:hypothetical protein
MAAEKPCVCFILIKPDDRERMRLKIVLRLAVFEARPPLLLNRLNFVQHLICMDHDCGLLRVTNGHKGAQHASRAENNCIVHFFDRIVCFIQ